LGEFYEKLKAKEKEIEILEKQIRDQQTKIENEQKEHDSLVLTVIISFWKIIKIEIEK